MKITNLTPSDMVANQRATPVVGTLIGVLAMGATVSLVVHLYCKRENARRDRTFKAPEAYTPEEISAESTKGDHATFFRFVD
ncbi:hypothetical protein FRC12_012647 [Ceratobasidium sp. 428]|nr:hypothetical protein FRC12_012647 [Ceratobasidium sp. 428]